MSVPNSSQIGYLAPDSNATPSPQGDAFVDFIQAVIAGVTGLDGRFVRPAWQPETPNLPPADQNWIAIHDPDYLSDTFAYIKHFGDDDGRDEMQRHEIVDFLLSFYGPAAAEYGALLRDGLQIAQNREVMQLNAVALVETSRATRAPELVKNIWLNRFDMHLVVRRQVRRTYRVLNLLSATGFLDNDHYRVPINVTEAVNP